jgi:hypothetical protein
MKCGILHFARDMAHFFHLTVVVQDVIDYGFAWFPKIHQSNENVSPSWHDLLGLLGFNHEQQHIVIGKFWDFIYKIAHRAIAHIHHVGNIKLLEDMLCNDTLSPN